MLLPCVIDPHLLHPQKRHLLRWYDLSSHFSMSFLPNLLTDLEVGGPGVVLVAVRVHASASGRGVIAAVRRDWWRVLVMSVGIGVTHRGTSVGGVVRWANIMGRGSEATTDDASLGVLGIGVVSGHWASSSTAEPLGAATRSVVVGW